MAACQHPRERLEILFPARDYITGHRFEIANCRNCGLDVTIPQPGGAEMETYYPPGYYGTASDKRFPAIVEWLQRQLYSRRADRVQSLAGKNGHVLDVGCGRGLLLREFQQRGWQVQGTELSDTASRFAREKLGLPVKIGFLEQIQFPPEHFDAVVLWHVLEHIPDPRAILDEIHRILKPGGVLMIGVPNFGSPEARLCRDKWFHLDVPRHLTHFTVESLRRLVADAGFECKGMSGFAPEYDSFSFVQSLLNRAGVRHNLLYNLLRGHGAKVLVDNRFNAAHVLATAVLTPMLGVISLPATAIAGLLRQGATMTLTATKIAKLKVSDSGQLKSGLEK